MKARVFFVVPSTDNIWGSTFLRGFQLCDIAHLHIADTYDFSIERMPMAARRYSRFYIRKKFAYFQRLWAATRPRDAIYFVTKQCVEQLDTVAAEILQSRARGVLFDYVDADMSTVSMRGADVHLCCSMEQYNYLSPKKTKNFSGAVELLPHGFDSRLSVVSPMPVAELRAVYMGAAKHLYIPDRLSHKVSVLNVTTSEDMITAIGQLGQHNLHYCVRRSTGAEGPMIFKPFIKGVSAAACGANVLVNRETHDAEAMLGDDYPYLISSLDEEPILKAFERAEAEIGGPEWRYASSIMAELAAKASPGKIATRLYEILQPLSD